MGKGKIDIGMTIKRVIVIVKLSITLDSHSGVSHNGSCAVGGVEVNLVGRFRSFVDSYLSILHIGNPRRICPSFFCRICQSLCQLFQQLI